MINHQSHKEGLKEGKDKKDDSKKSDKVANYKSKLMLVEMTVR